MTVIKVDFHTYEVDLEHPYFTFPLIVINDEVNQTFLWLYTVGFELELEEDFWE